MSTYVLISKLHIQARAKRLGRKLFLCQHMSLIQNVARKGLDKNVFMSTYVLISKFHIQARAKRLRKICFYVNICPYFKISYTSSENRGMVGGKRGGGGKGGGRIGIVAENRVGGERRGIGLDAKEWNIIPGSPGGRQTDRFLLR